MEILIPGLGGQNRGETLIVLTCRVTVFKARIVILYCIIITKNSQKLHEKKSVRFRSVSGLMWGWDYRMM